MLEEDGSDLDKDALQWACPGSSDISVSYIKEYLNKQKIFFLLWY